MGIKTLFQRAVEICSTEELLKQQIKKVSLFMLWKRLMLNLLLFMTQRKFRFTAM